MAGAPSVEVGLAPVTAILVSSGSSELDAVVRALEALPVAVVIVAADDAIALVNRAAERLFGYERTELLGQSVQILLPEGWWLRRGRGALIDRPGEAPAAHEIDAQRKDLSEVPIQLSLSRIGVAGTTFIALTAIDVTERRRMDDELRVLRDERPQFEALAYELAATITADAAVRQRLQETNAYLRRQLHGAGTESALVGNSLPMQQLVAQVKKAAATGVSVLLVGEPGTGKSLVAARIHELSARREREMIHLRCSVLTASQLERELGLIPPSGDTASAGSARLALAEGSTLYLDDVAKLPLDVQVLLAALLSDDARISDDGAPARIDARIIAATTSDLVDSVGNGAFRQDLYQRLAAMTIRVPPLRERPEDVPLLVWHFVDEFSRQFGKPIDTVDREAMATLQQYDWPGNAGELRNTVARAMMVTSDRHLRIAPPAELPSTSATLAAVEKDHITRVLAACDWRLEGEGGAAAKLGLTARALRNRMRRLGIHTAHG